MESNEYGFKKFSAASVELKSKNIKDYYMALSKL
jgi:hypothetical protein